jgi:ankyrin repeat protein
MEKRRREDGEEPDLSPGCCEAWPPSRVESLDSFLQSVREHVLSCKQPDANPVNILMEYASANLPALTAKFFPTRPRISSNRALDSFESCFHSASSESSSCASGVDLSGSIAPTSTAGTPFTRKKQELSPPPGALAEDNSLWKLADTREYPSGNAGDYQRGISKRIGFPCVANFEDGMRIEHCVKAGCCYSFAPRNQHWAGNKTTPKDEWHIVLCGAKADGLAPPECQFSGGRRRIFIDELLQLPLAKTAKLRREEIIGLALYSGPMYEIYNGILQRRYEHWNAFEDKHHFPTTLSVIVSAIQKVGSVTPLNPGHILYRGNGGLEYMPPCFFDGDDMNRRGVTAYTFQSFSTSLRKAIEYAKPDCAWPMVFVVEPSKDPLTGFANISDFSQYPSENEHLLPPCCFLHPDILHSKEIPQHGKVKFCHIRVTGASQSYSLEDLEKKKKQIHMAEFENRVAELRAQLEKTALKHNAEARLLWPSEQKHISKWKKAHSVTTLLNAIVEKVNVVLKRHNDSEFSEFNKKNRYSDFVQESLDCVRMAPSLLKLWLRDENEHIHHVENYEILAGHRWFIAFLKREYKNKPGDRTKYAGKLCKHLALMSDSNQRILEETPLMKAAVAGLNDETLEILVAAGENVQATKSKNGMCALHLAAENGHTHCIRSLVRLGAAIDQPTLIGTTALHRACMFSHSHCVDALASLRADVNKACAMNRTPMAEAAQSGFHLCIEELARHGADLDMSDNKNFSPLYVACAYGKASCVASLLRLGANPNFGPNAFDSPLRVASKNGHCDCVHEFRRVAHVSLFQTAANPIIVAIANQHSLCVYALLSLNPPLNVLLGALFAAIGFGNVQVMRALVMSSFQGNLSLLQSKDEDGLTAEQFACVCGSDESIIAMLRSSANDPVQFPGVGSVVQEPIHWKSLTATCNSLRITFCDTLRFYAPADEIATAIAPYGCCSGVCAYFEVTIRSPGLTPQFGLCGAQFVEHLRQRIAASPSTDGVGDKSDSWAVDGVRCLKWNASKSSWNVSWRQGDVIGIACNMCTRQMIVSRNGDYSFPNGAVFDLSPAASVLYPALSTNVDGHLRANLGPFFTHLPPSKEYVSFASLPFVDYI